ncbi:phosphoribosyl-ATP diphosphatase [Enterococcus sp. LJL98]
MDSLVTLYEEIVTRRNTPKEGSYTNYLFSKGLDKILKKVGEEATEVVIAAKNHDKEELVAESADLLYHLLVLLAENNISLMEIEKELSDRQGKISQTKEREKIIDL